MSAPTGVKGLVGWREQREEILHACVCVCVCVCVCRTVGEGKVEGTDWYEHPIFAIKHILHILRNLQVFPCTLAKLYAAPEVEKSIIPEISAPPPPACPSPHIL